MTQTFEQASASSAINEFSAKCLHKKNVCILESKQISPPGPIPRNADDINV